MVFRHGGNNFQIPNMVVVIATLITNTASEGLTMSGVKVFSLQRGVWSNPTTNVFIRHDFPKDEARYFTDLTICYRLRLEKFAEYNIHLSYAISHKEANTLLFYNMATEMMAYINNLKQTIKAGRPLEIFPETWNHFCHLLSQGNYSIYWQGNFYGESQVLEAQEYLLNGTLILGQEQDSLGGTFAASQVLQGDIAQLNIWDRLLTAKEIEDLANCQTDGRGNIFSLDTARVDMLGNINITTLQVNDLCLTLPQYLVLPERRSVADSLAHCNLLNASMIVPTSTQDNSRLRNLIVPFMESCSSTPWKVWLGITDEMHEGVWIDLNRKNRLKYDNFVSPYPYGGSVENCAALLPDGTWGDAKCNLKKCSACQLQSAGYLFLRGLCFEDEHQTRFRVEGYVEGRPLFRGFYDLLIMWNKANSEWLLLNTANTTIASMTPSDLKDYPLGQHEWTVRNLICGSHVGTRLNLSLSPCTPHHFMCRSGECIAHQYRCNLRFECEDGSDEDDCDVVYLNDGYRSHLPPPGDGHLPLQLAMNFTLSRFAAVDTVKMSISVEFRVSITWLDNRLGFSHLESTKNRAILTRKDVEKIWLPRYRLMDLEGGQVKLLEQVVQVNSATNPKLPDTNAVKMDLMYPGAENKLTLIQDYTANFACYFHFMAFPFDVQVCHITLRLPSSYEDFVQISREEREVYFSGPQELAFFSVENVRSGSTWEEHQLHVQLELSCHGSSIVLSFFLPALLLLVVSWATLFVKWEDFIVRSMMSFGTLLVFFLLRLTLLNNTPATMTIKFMDIWVFFIVLILFINVLIHVFVKETFTVDYMRNKPLLMRPAGGAVMITPESSQPPSFDKYLVWYRNVFLPIIVIIFNVVFWVALFFLR